MSKLSYYAYYFVRQRRKSGKENTSTYTEREWWQLRDNELTAAFRQTFGTRDEKPPFALHCYLITAQNIPPILFIGNAQPYTIPNWSKEKPLHLVFLHTCPSLPPLPPPFKSHGSFLFNEKLQSCPWPSSLEQSLAPFQFCRSGWSGDGPLFWYDLLWSGSQCSHSQYSHTFALQNWKTWKSP